MCYERHTSSEPIIPPGYSGVSTNEFDFCYDPVFPVSSACSKEIRSVTLPDIAFIEDATLDQEDSWKGVTITFPPSIIIKWEPNPFDHQRRNGDFCNAVLDSYPYSGHTTAQDALYAGVPIVTRSDGVEMASRVNTAANVVLGLGELNAVGGLVEYRDIAIRLGTDRSFFGEMRERLLDTCLKRDPMHPYWDVERYVRDFEALLMMAWALGKNPARHDHGSFGGRALPVGGSGIGGHAIGFGNRENEPTRGPVIGGNGFHQWSMRQNVGGKHENGIGMFGNANANNRIGGTGGASFTRAQILRLAKGGMAKMLDEFVVLCKFIESITFNHFQHRAQGKKH
jgi:hypothetical protein